MIIFYLNLACTLDFPNRNPESFPDNPLADFDGDGFTEQTGDCDDLDPELGQEPTWYLDSDGDG